MISHHKQTLTSSLYSAQLEVLATTSRAIFIFTKCRRAGKLTTYLFVKVTSSGGCLEPRPLGPCRLLMIWMRGSHHRPQTMVRRVCFCVFCRYWCSLCVLFCSGKCLLMSFANFGLASAVARPVSASVYVTGKLRNWRRNNERGSTAQLGAVRDTFALFYWSKSPYINPWSHADGGHVSFGVRSQLTLPVSALTSPRRCVCFLIVSWSCQTAFLYDLIVC